MVAFNMNDQGTAE